jgi:predicted DNA-binding transcriptional regulator AlpA
MSIHQTDYTVHKSAYSIDEFCTAHGLSRSSFYKMLKQGTAPRLLKVGKAVRVSIEAAADWRRERERAA